jgi:hypothetical protein
MTSGLWMAVINGRNKAFRDRPYRVLPELRFRSTLPSGGAQNRKPERKSGD